MNVVVLDDVANVGFNYVKGLRKAGVKADLLVREGYPNLPEKHGWIKFYNNSNPLFKFVSLWKLTRKYDLIHSQGGSAVFAQFLGKRHIAHAMGSDLRLVAGKNTLSDILKGKIYFQKEWSLFENLRNVLVGFLLRRAFKKADKFFCSQPDQIPLLEKMNLQNVECVFQLIDTNKFRPPTEKEIEAYKAKDRLLVKNFRKKLEGWWKPEWKLSGAEGCMDLHNITELRKEDGFNWLVAVPHENGVKNSGCGCSQCYPLEKLSKNVLAEYPSCKTCAHKSILHWEIRGECLVKKCGCKQFIEAN